MVSAVILAAGLSKRMGQNKLLLKLNNQSIIEHVVSTVIKCKIDEIIVVLGRDAEVVYKVLSKYPVQTVINPDYELGQSSSVKSGLSLVDNESECTLFFMGDQPFIDEQIINQEINFFRNNDFSIIVPTYNGNRGNPVLFASEWYPVLKKISGDQGGRQIIKNNQEAVHFFEIENELFLKDIDTQEEYYKVKDSL